MMEAAQNRRRDDSMIGRQLVAVRRDYSVGQRIRKPRSETAMWSAVVVMADPLPKNGAKMRLGHRNHEVQTLTTDRPDHALAESVRLGNAWRCFQNLQPHRLEGAIDTFRVNRVAIVDDESVPLIAGHNHPKLLRRPVRGRMICHVPMQDSSCPDFQHDKHVDHAEGGRRDDKEITGEDRPGVVPDEGAPRLCAAPGAPWSRRHVPADGPRRLEFRA